MGDGHETPLQDDSEEEWVMLEESRRRNAAHTPGPWTHSAMTSAHHIYLYANVRGNQITVGALYPNPLQMLCISAEEMNANARLWDAAPDLLAALKELSSKTQDVPALKGSILDAVTAARRAIAKAEGRS